MARHVNNTSTSPTKRGAAPREGDAKGRIAPALREAIKLRVEKGLTITAACDAAGYSESGWHLAMQRPHVRQLLNDVQAQYIQSVKAKRAYYSSRAYDIAADLMENATDPAMRWKGVEFFTRDDAPRKGDAPQVSVNIASGYEFVRPGQRVVDLIDGTSPDTVSGALAGDGDGTSTG